MKLKKLLAFGLALVMCLAMAACGTNPDEKTDAEPVSITVTENWDFSVGFYPVITPMVSLLAGGSANGFTGSSVRSPAEGYAVPSSPPSSIVTASG